jgi:hypothetical protein
MDPSECPILAHSDLGDPECCGCLIPVTQGDQIDIVCNECRAVTRSVAPADFRRTFDEMELSLDMTSEKCPYCGAVTLFPGFSRVVAFVCQECGRGVSLPE